MAHAWTLTDELGQQRATGGAKTHETVMENPWSTRKRPQDRIWKQSCTAEGMAQSGPLSVATDSDRHWNGSPWRPPSAEASTAKSVNLAFAVTRRALFNIMVVMYVFRRLRFLGAGACSSTLPPSFRLQAARKYCLWRSRAFWRASPSRNSESPVCCGGTCGHGWGRPKGGSKGVPKGAGGANEMLHFRGPKVQVDSYGWSVEPIKYGVKRFRALAPQRNGTAFSIPLESPWRGPGEPWRGPFGDSGGPRGRP